MLQMKKLSIFVSLILLLCLLSGCTLNLPFSPQESFAKPVRIFRVYVCGAVENEGYVEVCEGADYASLITLAGIIPQTVFPKDSLLLVKETSTILNVCYFDGTKVCYCVNLNGGYITLRDVANVDKAVVDKIADYLELHGKITNRNVLRSILSESEYNENYFKFFVSESDYEEDS